MSDPGLDIHRGGAGEPLVLIHGIGHSWRAWRPVLPLLEARHDVLAVDMPGFGRSAPLPVTSTAEALADAVEEEMDRQGLATAHVAGNSLGGSVGAILARRGRARTLVALSPHGLYTDRESRYQQAMLRMTFAAGGAPGLKRMLDFLPTRVQLGWLMFGRPWRGDPEALYEQARMLAGSPSFIETMHATHGVQPHGLDAIECPVLIAWGTRDRLLLPRQAKRWKRAIPHAELRYLRGVGHIPMPDDPELVAGTISEFAARPSTRRPAPAPA